MSTISAPLVADWIRKGLRWKYIFRDIRKPFSIPLTEEKKVAMHQYPEGIFLFGKFVFDRPFGGVRIDAYPEWPITLDIPTLWADGVLAPNVWGWISRYRPAPFVGQPGTYALVIPQGQVWQNIFEMWVINTNLTIPINCLRYLYAMAVLLEPRSPEQAEVFEVEREN